MKTFLLSSWRPIFFRREGGGRGGALLACAKGSSLELWLWSIFALTFRALSISSSDWSPFRAARALGRGDPVTDDAAAGSQWQECVPNSASRRRPSFSVTVSFAPRAANASSNWSKAICDLLRRCSVPLNCLTHATTRQERSPTLLPEGSPILETAPAAGRTCSGSIPAAGEYVPHMHLLSSGGSTVNTERTGASFGEANACRMRCFFKIISCVVCCALLLGNCLRWLLTVCGTLGMEKNGRCPGNRNRI